MRAEIETVALEGPNVRVKLRDTVSVEPRVLTLAAALRLFEQYAVLQRLTLATPDVEVAVSREAVTRLLGPEGFAALKDRARYRQILSQGLPGDRGDASA